MDSTCSEKSTWKKTSKSTDRGKRSINIDKYKEIRIRKIDMSWILHNYCEGPQELGPEGKSLTPKKSVP